MPWRNVLPLIAICLFVGASSCDESNLTDVAPGVPFSHSVFAGPVASAGRFHNDIVEAYVRLRPFDTHTLLDRREFVRNMIRASNEALAARGLPPVVRTTEIERVLEIVGELRRLGIYDFRSPADSDPARILDYLSVRGAITPRDADVVRHVAAVARSKRTEPERLFFGGNSQSEALALFESVYRASSELWRSGRIRPLTPGQGGPSLLSRKSDGIMMDAIGALFGTFLGGPIGGIIGGALFSILFFEEPPGGGDGGWTCPDWCDAA